MTDEEQLTLPLEMPVYEAYTIELRKGAVVGALDVVRHHTAPSVDLALNLIEGLRDAARQRDDVQWQDEEVDAGGNLYGMAHGVVFQISVVPPLGDLAE